MDTRAVIEKTQSMIDGLKAVCANYGLSNTGGEYKIVTEVFLYKYLNDKFLHEIRSVRPEFSGNTEELLSALSAEEYESLFFELPPGVARLSQKHFISYLYNHKNEADFAQMFDATLEEISSYDENLSVFSVRAGGGEAVKLFDPLSPYVLETGKRDAFCRALVDKLVEFSFEDTFAEGYDFFSVIFEYLISDYNKDSGKYGEYYTPHSIASIIAKILVPGEAKNVTIYDPSAGTGTLLLALAHQVGVERCSIYSQDISQKSCEFLRLNMILHNLVHSLDHVVNGDTLVSPQHHNPQKTRLTQFDYIVSNPPFNMDFSETRDELAGDAHKARFFAGVPNIPPNDKEKMAVYLMFIQHILHSLKEKGKAAIVVPTGFLTAKNGIEKRIRQYIVEKKMLKGVVSMPPNIFATTGTNVSVLFLDGGNKTGDAVLIDASKLGEKVKINKKQRTILSTEELDRIVSTFHQHENVEDFCQIVTFEEMEQKNFSFSAGQYFEVKIEYVELTAEEFNEKISSIQERLAGYFKEGEELSREIQKQIAGLKYD